tara:strand:- start:507 stop:1373 length:867 start_codon:yes stop_codon:yes gene_type:complete
MAFLDRTTGANFIPELWADPIYKFYKETNKLANSVDDYSALVKGAGDTVHIPKIALKAAVEKASSTVVDFSTAATAGKVDLSINKHYVVPELFEDIALVQSSSDLMSKYTKMMGEAIARQVESDMWAELDGFQTRVDVSANNTFGVATLESVLANLYAIDIDPNDCSMALSNLLIADMLNPSGGIAQYFIRQDASGEGQGLRTGAIGLIYGMDVFHTAAAPTATTNDLAIGAVYPSDACVFAAQQDVRVQSQYDIAYLGTKVTADIIYGMKLIDESGDLRGLNLVNLG